MAEIISQKSVNIPLDSVVLEGDLSFPLELHAMVIFAHGSGSSRLSPRNRLVAQKLNEAGIGTLLFDLLTRHEDADYENRFNLPLLTERLEAATQWLKSQPQTEGLPVGYFGASTGAAAALMAAADFGDKIGAVVSRGGRPDLAKNVLHKVLSPVLLIVGGDDTVVIGLNRFAYNLISAEKDMKIVPGATHLFEEPGTLEEAARLAAGWFRQYLFSGIGV